MIQQVEFSLRPLPRGFHLVTNEVMRNLPALPKTGILNLFVRHTSCGLSLNENFDPDVRHDLKGIFEDWFQMATQIPAPDAKDLRKCRPMPNRAWWVITHHSYYQWQTEPWYMAGDLPLRIQRGRRKPTPHRNDYRGINPQTVAIGSN